MKATKKTSTKTAESATKTPAKAAKPAKAAAAATAPRHPLARLQALHGSKEKLVATLVEPLSATDEDTDSLRKRLLKASNQKLLHLASVVESVKKTFGGRDKMIDAIGRATNKAKDKDFLTKLGQLPLPRLLDLAKSSQRRAKHA